jgi:hypothetical protein
MTAVGRRGWRVLVVGLAIAIGLVGALSSGAGATTSAIHQAKIHQSKIRWSARARAARSDLIDRKPLAVRLAGAPTPKIVARDPRGDIKVPQADVTAVGFGRNANGFVFSVNVAHPVNPKTDPGFQVGFSYVGWALDTNNDREPEHIVFLQGDGAGRVVAVMFSVASQAGCPGAAVYKPGAGYQAVFSPRCGAGIHSFRMQAAAVYSADPDEAEPPVDIAPNNGWTGTLALSESQAGYWLLGSDGQTHGFGLARQFRGGVFGAASIATKRNGSGYWVIDRNGGAHAFGSATNRGGYPLLQPGERITASAATPSGNGYWMFSNIGRAFVFGDAHSFGDMSSTRLRGQIVAAAATPSGRGYYLLGSDGGVFTFGDARFRGSLGARTLNGPVVDIATSEHGYWLFASDGGVFAFNAPFRGSMGGRPLNAPVTTGVAVGNGYLLVSADGGVFNFSDHPFVGSLAAKPMTSMIIDVAGFTK